MKELINNNTMVNPFRKFSISFILFAGIFIIAPGEIPAQNIQSQSKGPSAINGFTVKQQAELILYNRMLFGQFIEHFHRQIYGGIFDPGSKLSDKDGFRKDVTEALRQLKVPIVRWPGGCFVSSYHWLDGTGSKRIPTYDKAWKVEEPNTFGTDEYIKWCRLIGAEPYICTNAGTGTPEEMSDWVEYCNLNIGKYGRIRRENGNTDPYNVLYWSVGNENWGAHEIGAKTIAEWGGLVRESSKMMRAVTPYLKLFAAALTDTAWTVPLLKEAGYLLDYVSIHGYWDPLWAVNNISPYLDCMMRTTAPEADILRTIRILDETGFRGKIKIAFDEWNLRGWHHPVLGDFRKEMDYNARDKNDINSTYTMADALFSACFLNACLRNASDVEIACFSPIVNARGAIYVHPKGIVRRTTFHVFDLYANQLEKNVMPIEISSEMLTKDNLSTPMIDAILTCNDSRTRFSLAVVNKSPDRTVDFHPDFKGLHLEIPGKISATVLSGRTPDDFNDIGAEDRVIPVQMQYDITNDAVSLPPHSLVIFRF
jgi:alpha-N-arabinofuranosidase